MATRTCACIYCIKKELFEGNETMDRQMMLDGTKNDNGKPQLGLVPKSLIWAVGTILTFGASKYGRDNWRKGLAWSRPYDALLRHLTAWYDGETSDSESKKSHLWHAACELAFLIEYEDRGIGQDDRFITKTDKELSDGRINGHIRSGS